MFSAELDVCQRALFKRTNNMTIGSRLSKLAWFGSSKRDPQERGGGELHILRFVCIQERSSLWVLVVCDCFLMASVAGDCGREGG